MCLIHGIATLVTNPPKLKKMLINTTNKMLSMEAPRVEYFPQKVQARQTLYLFSSPVQMQPLPTLGFAKLSCNAYGDWLESWTQTFFVHAVLLARPRKLVTKRKGLISLCLRVWERFVCFQEKFGERLKTNPFTLNSKNDTPQKLT